MRNVAIIYDSDSARKPQVRGEAENISRELANREAAVSIVELPDLPRFKKTGLDDFIVANGASALREIIEAAPEFEENKILRRFNAENVYVCDSDIVFELKTRISRDPRRFRDRYRNIRIKVTTVAGKTEDKAAPDIWLEWPKRRQAPRLSFEPGAPEITSDGSINLWKGWGAEPIKGGLAPWIDLLDHIFGENQESRRFFEQWCAYPIQHPGAKLFTAVVLWGPQQAGKSLLGKVLGSVYHPDHTAEIGQDQILAPFNEHLRYKQFILGDEVSSTDRLKDADKLKALITRKTVEINGKYERKFVIRDTVNFLFSSNHPNAVFLENDDRRFYIVHVTEKLSDDRGTAIAEWAESESGRSALLYYLLNEVDLTGFSPSARAPMTAAKLEMIDDNRSDLDSFAANLVDACQSENKAPRHQDIRTIESMAAQFESQKNRRPAEKSLGHSLKRTSATKLKRVRVGAQFFSVWALANGPHWLKADSSEIVEALRANGQVDIAVTNAKAPKF
jgi:hypothetical protein